MTALGRVVHPSGTEQRAESNLASIKQTAAKRVRHAAALRCAAFQQIQYLFTPSYIPNKKPPANSFAGGFFFNPFSRRVAKGCYCAGIAKNIVSPE